jgi:hypothetical protein
LLDGKPALQYNELMPICHQASAIQLISYMSMEIAHLNHPRSAAARAESAACVHAMRSLRHFVEQLDHGARSTGHIRPATGPPCRAWYLILDPDSGVSNSIGKDMARRGWRQAVAASSGTEPLLARFKREAHFHLRTGSRQIAGRITMIL